VLEILAVFQARKRFGISVLTYIATSNHVHLLVRDSGRGEMRRSMQLIAGRTAQEYNQRKSRKGAFWEGRYFATAVNTDKHLIRCLVYIDLNMVRTGIVADHFEIVTTELFRPFQVIVVYGDDAAVFENLLLNINDITYFTALNHFNLGSNVDARINIADFAIFLHRNPGARRVWEARESGLAEGREVVQSELTEDAIKFNFPYVEWVMQALEDLDQTVE
jgi:REP element-mobilizing transposase RayT